MSDHTGWQANNHEDDRTPEQREDVGRDLWRDTYAACGRAHDGPCHDRPTRSQDAGHDRERDET